MYRSILASMREFSEMAWRIGEHHCANVGDGGGGAFKMPTRDRQTLLDGCRSWKFRSLAAAEYAYSTELAAALFYEFVRREVAQRIQAIENRGLGIRGSLVAIAMGAAQRLGDDLVDNAVLERRLSR